MTTYWPWAAEEVSQELVDNNSRLRPLPPAFGRC